MEITSGYCPRCDKKFETALGAKRLKEKIDEHVLKAHPEYYEMELHE